MILYEDKDIIVCHKPSGLPVQSARLGQKDMVSVLNNHLAEKAWGNPAGMMPGNQSEMVQNKRPQKKQPERMQKIQEFVHVVHRLDQPVEGVIVFAKNPKAAANLTKQIQQDSVKKIYQAVCCVGDKSELLRQQPDVIRQNVQEMNVDKSTEAEKTDDNCGKLSKNPKSPGISADTKAQNCKAEKKKASGTMHLEDYLVKDGRTNTSRIASKKEKDAKLAVLDYEVLAQKGCYKLVQVYLKTGRHHQIRVQMSHAGLPLYGDQKYHESWQEFEWVKESEQQMMKPAGAYVQSGYGNRKVQLALCAVSYSFRHPSTGKEMKFEVKPENPVFGLFKHK